MTVRASSDCGAALLQSGQNSIVLCEVNTLVQASENATPCTISDVVAALNSQKVQAHHDKQDWGDWIVLKGSETVISIESVREVTTTATIEHAENEAKGLAKRLRKAFHSLGWEGIGEDGTYALV